MQDLVGLLIAKTIGYDLASIKSANDGILKMEEEIKNIKDHSSMMVSNEFTQTFGLSLVDFAAQWRSLKSDLEMIKEEHNEPKVNTLIHKF